MATPGAFATIASYVDAEPIDPVALAAAASEIGTYEDFLAELRQKAGAESLASAD